MKQLMSASKLLGCSIKHFIDGADTNQTELSDVTGIPRSSLNRKLNGGVFDYEELDKIAHALNVPLSKIVAKAEETSASIDSSATESKPPAFIPSQFDAEWITEGGNDENR